VRQHFDDESFFGTAAEKSALWEEVNNILTVLSKKYLKDNAKMRNGALVDLASWGLLGIALLVIDFLSNWVCDWWLQVCRDASWLMFYGYMLIFAFIGYKLYSVFQARGYGALLSNLSELLNEMQRLSQLYATLVSLLPFKTDPTMALQALQEVRSSGVEEAVERLQMAAQRKNQ